MKQLVEDTEALILRILENAANLRLNLEEDEVIYDLTYIRHKLAQCSSYIEQLSDAQMQLTRISLEVTKTAAGHHGLLDLEGKKFKASPEYAAQPVAAKGHWLDNQLTSLRSEAERWSGLRRVVSEVKEAVGERTQTMKRLDSDLRLHSKLYEAKVLVGAMSPHATANRRTEDEINIT